MRTPLLAMTAILLGAWPAWADDGGAVFFRTAPDRGAWHLGWEVADPDVLPPNAGAFTFAPTAASVSIEPEPPPAQPEQPLHPAAIEHSDAYQTRAKIHKYASFATLPLFAAEFALGQSLYDPANDTSGKRTAHAFIGAGIVGLFGVNTVTGAWNLFGEGWSDPEGRTLRLVHGLLMMAADVGFLATTQSGPNSRGRRALTFATDRATHRNIAIASMSVGTAGYLLMLFGNR